MKNISLIQLSIFIGLSLFLNLTSFGQNHPFHNGEKAFDGNDIISYFEGEVKKGNDKITFEYKEVLLYFATERSREKFKKEPEKYFASYNGWCAIALTKGTFRKPDYNNFKIQEGNLLFFEVRAFFNGKTAWEKNPEVNKITADENYKKLKVD